MNDSVIDIELNINKWQVINYVLHLICIYQFPKTVRMWQKVNFQAEFNEFDDREG